MTARAILIELTPEQREGLDKVYAHTQRNADRERPFEEWTYTVFRLSAFSFRQELDILENRGKLVLQYAKSKEVADSWFKSHPGQPLPEEDRTTVDLIDADVEWTAFRAAEFDPDQVPESSVVVKFPEKMLEWIERGLALHEAKMDAYPDWIEDKKYWETVEEWAKDSLLRAVEMSMTEVRKQEVRDLEEELYPGIHSDEAKGLSKKERARQRRNEAARGAGRSSPLFP